MTDCEKILNLIPLYIDNMLSDEENDIVIRHIKTCKACQSELEYLKSIIDTTKDIPEIDLPSDFHKNLIEKAEIIKQSKKKKRYLIFKRAGVYAAAAAVVALSFLAFGEFIKPQDDKDTDQYLTSKISPEPYSYEEKSDLTKSTADKKSEITHDASKSSKKDFAAAEETQAHNVRTEEKEISQVPASISVDDQDVTYTTVTVELTEEIKEEALKILSQYEKDQKGYIVPDIDRVIEKIKKLGAIVEFETDGTVVQNYVVIK